MHELLLFGQVPPWRHDQVLNILAGVAAMQPVPVVEKHLVFKPNRLSGVVRPVQLGGAQDIQKTQVQALQAQSQGDLFYMQLVADSSNTSLEKQADEGLERKTHGSDEDVPDTGGPSTDNVENIERAASTQAYAQNWTLQFRDLPEVIHQRQRQVTSRVMADIPIISGDPIHFMTALDYSHTSTYILVGHRFTHLAASIMLYQLFLPSTSSEKTSNTSIMDISQAHLLDASGSYILQAAVRVQEGSKVETMTKGLNELLSLKETLKGVVEMDMGDRLALDTRVR